MRWQDWFAQTIADDLITQLNLILSRSYALSLAQTPDLGVLLLLTDRLALNVKKAFRLRAPYLLLIYDNPEKRIDIFHLSYIMSKRTDRPKGGKQKKN